MTSSDVPVKAANGSTMDVQPLTTGPACSWVITGGTGAYAGLQGSGSSFADAGNTFPWINHTEYGTVREPRASHYGAYVSRLSPGEGASRVLAPFPRRMAFANRRHGNRRCVNYRG